MQQDKGGANRPSGSSFASAAAEDDEETEDAGAAKGQRQLGEVAAINDYKRMSVGAKNDVQESRKSDENAPSQTPIGAEGGRALRPFGAAEEEVEWGCVAHDAPEKRFAVGQVFIVVVIIVRH